MATKERAWDPANDACDDCGAWAPSDIYCSFCRAERDEKARETAERAYHLGQYGIKAKRK